MGELKASVAYTFGVRMVDTADRPKPKSGIAYSDIIVRFRYDGSSAWSTKSLAAANWTEVGYGIYLLSFASVDLATSGEFDFLVSETVPYSNFDDYGGNIYIPMYSSEDLYNAAIDIQIDVLALMTTCDEILTVVEGLGTTTSVEEIKTLIGSPEYTTLAGDNGILLDALLGNKARDKTLNPWRDTFYKRDGSSLQSFDYEIDASEETRTRR